MCVRACVCVSSKYIWLIPKRTPNEKTRLLHHFIIIINMRPLFRAISSTDFFIFLCSSASLLSLSFVYASRSPLSYIFLLFASLSLLPISIVSFLDARFWAFISFFSLFCWLVFYILALRRRMAATRP